MGILSGQSAIITGASSGMARATVLAFASAGARVLAVARREEELRKVAEEAAAAGGEVSIQVADISKREDDDAVVRRAVELFGKVDVLVNAAGINIPNRAIDALTDDDWRKIIDINLNGAYYVTRAILPAMKSSGGGLIIHIGSVSGRWGDRSGIAYQASKHGLMGLAYGTMVEERLNGIRISVVMPGLCDTPLLNKRPVPTPQEKLSKAMQPEDIAQGCLFLASLPARTYVPELIMMPGALQCIGENQA